MFADQFLPRIPPQIPISRQSEDVDIEDQESIVIDHHDDEILDSGNDSEVNSGNSNGRFDDFTRNGMVKVGEGSTEYNAITKTFLEGMGIYGKDTSIEAIHKNSFSGPAGKARWLCFRVYAQATSTKTGGNSNLRFAWFGSSREKLSHIISHGFSFSNETASDEFHGYGISLSPPKFCIDSVASAIADENGLKHILLCRVIMGKTEVVPLGSKQFQPSSTEFDSGVDNLEDPRKFIIWSAFMNSHIFPAYIISFKAPSFNGMNANVPKSVRPSSPWMSFPALVNILSKFLDTKQMAVIYKSYDDFRKNKMNRLTLIKRMRQISGDKLLIGILRNYKEQLAVKTAYGQRK